MTRLLFSTRMILHNVCMCTWLRVYVCMCAWPCVGVLTEIFALEIILSVVNNGVLANKVTIKIGLPPSACIDQTCSLNFGWQWNAHLLLPLLSCQLFTRNSLSTSFLSWSHWVSLCTTVIQYIWNHAISASRYLLWNVVTAGSVLKKLVMARSLPLTIQCSQKNLC